MHHWCKLIDSDKASMEKERMNPITSHYEAQIHMEELHRDAEQYRLACEFGARASTSTRVQTAAGRWLISVGERLVAGSTMRTVSSQR